MKASRQSLDDVSTLPGLTPHEVNISKSSFALAREDQELRPTRSSSN